VRSKGVGVYFVTQNPLDVPDKVSAQLGNRIQHALRAFTPREQKSVRAAAETFRPNPKLKNTAAVIMELGTGEALVSVLEGRGQPTMVERTLIRPPSGQIGPITDAERRRILNVSDVGAKYDEAVDNESAYELLQKRAAEAAAAAEAAEREATRAQDPMGSILGTIFGTSPAPQTGPRGGKSRQPRSATEQVVTSAARSMATSVGRQVGTALVRGILGSLSGGRRR
jgi:DNA helicase HerA-like ATPase